MSAVEQSVGTGTVADLPYLDMESEDFFAAPYERLDAMRRQSWAARSAMGVVLLSHKAIQDLYADPRLRQPGIEVFKFQGVTEGPAYDWWETHLVHLEGQTHTRIRRLVAGAFSPKSVDRYRERMRTQVRELAAMLPVDEPFDFVERYADPLPIGVTCAILGVDPADVAKFGKWAGDVTRIAPTQLKENLPVIEDALRALFDYVEYLVERRRREMGDDLVSELLRSQEGGNRLSLDELKSLIVLLLVGGLDTTRFALAWCLVTFLDRPEDWDELAAHPELAPSVAEEMLRYRPAIMENFRFTKVDVTYAGITIPANTLLSISTAAANWDDACAANGSEFQLHRPPSQHISFGKGSHFCLGASLARAELEETLRTLPALMNPIRWEGEARYRIPRMISGPEKVPMSFSRRAG
jgi:cytochrome P450